MTALHIKQWETLYETSETRKIRALTFYAKPNKLVGIGINRTRQTERGLELLGTFGLMVDLASHGPPGQRGWFIRDGKPLDAAGIAYLLMLPEEAVTAAIKHFSTDLINWLEWTEYSPGSPRISGNDRENTGRTPGDSPGSPRISGNDRENTPAISARGKIDRRGKTDKRQKEKINGFATVEAEAAAQTRQFASCDARRKALEAVAEEDRSEAEEAELKKMRRILQAIQKKQAAGDFTLVTEN